MGKHGSRCAKKGGSERGFSLLEVLVGLSLLGVVAAGMLGFLSTGDQLARSEMRKAEMQQEARVSLRMVARLGRMLGRGGLPAGHDPLPLMGPAPVYPLPQGLAVSVRNNVGGDPPRIVAGDDATPAIVAGTDVLTLRGVFNSPVYQLNHTDETVFSRSPGEPLIATLRLADRSPAGIPQDLSLLSEVLDLARPADPEQTPKVIPEAVLLLGPQRDFYGVAELDPLGSRILVDPGDPDDPGDDRTTLELRLVLFIAAEPDADPDRPAAAYAALGPGSDFSTELFDTGVAYAGILEEYRFYVRDEVAVAGDPTSGRAPRLSMARVLPGTDLAYAGDPENLRLDIADHVVDLQVALGFDSPLAGSWDDDADDTGDDDQIYESLDGTADDWLFNHPSDGPTRAPWDSISPARLYYLRLTTLTRTRYPDRHRLSRAVPTVEDAVYGPQHPVRWNPERYRWQHLQTVIDMRNL